MDAFLKFNKGVMKMPMPWQGWLMLLVGANLIAPLFFLNSLEAQATVATMLLSMALMTVLTARFGFTRILGLGHVLWIPLLIFLLVSLRSIPADDTFGIWIRTLILLNATSLLIDARDVIRYIAGDRQEVVAGL